MNIKQSDIRIFGKPITHPYRRMAVALAYDRVGSDVDAVKQHAVEIAGMVKVESK